MIPMARSTLSRAALCAAIAVLLSPASIFTSQSTDDNSIRPYHRNPWYWQYRGEPVVLIGGTDDDNLFQWTGQTLTDHLDLLVSVRGNYVRNTMSDRDEGNVYAFRQVKDDTYDLAQWNDEYWNRLTFFLDQTAARGIIVQLTLWDQFDVGGQAWRRHPWNPGNNVNLQHGALKDRDDFYSSVARNDAQVLRYQHLFIDRLLSTTLGYQHVLYNINNESSEGAEWENYWAQYIRRAAEQKGRRIYVASMQFDASSAVRHAMTFRHLYDFAEISQNNQDSRGGRGRAHWDRLLFLRSTIASQGPMPMNNEKVYGGLDGRNYSAGSETEAMDRFWRNIFGGSASSRFHRSEAAWGSGLNERVRANLRAMSMLLGEIDVFSSIPQNDLLSSPGAFASTMEAYCTASIGKHYAVYFPAGRYRVELDPWVFVKQLKLRWLDIDTGRWSDEQVVDVQWTGGLNDWGDRGAVRLETPDNRAYVALLQSVE